MPNDPCEKCGLRPNTWFTDEGYLCTPCTDELRRRQQVVKHDEMVESMTRALMEVHHDDWDMETVREAAHICAQVAIPVPGGSRA
jgi:hypothetical protein